MEISRIFQEIARHLDIRPFYQQFTRDKIYSTQNFVINAYIFIILAFVCHFILDSFRTFAEKRGQTQICIEIRLMLEN